MNRFNLKEISLVQEKSIIDEDSNTHMYLDNAQCIKKKCNIVFNYMYIQEEDIDDYVIPKI